MLIIPSGVKIHLALGRTDMRKGFDSLAVLVQEVLKKDPFSGHLFAFRGKKADTMKIMFWDATGCASSPSGCSKAASSGPRCASPAAP